MNDLLEALETLKKYGLAVVPQENGPPSGSVRKRVNKAFTGPKARTSQGVKITAEMQTEIRELAERGFKYNQVAEKFGIHTQTVGAIVRGQGCYAPGGGKPRVRRKHLSDAERDQIRLLHKDGKDLTQIAKALKRSKTTIRREIKKAA
jgi:DNA-binding NarL/FixJ family response regulator